MRLTPAVLTILALVPSRSVIADTYVVPDDFRVTALDLTTGKELWTRTPGPLGGGATLAVEGGLLVVRDGPPTAKKQRSYHLDPKTGKRSNAKRRAPAIGMLDELPRPLRDSRGRQFAYSSGNTRDLEVVTAHGTRQVLELESFVHDLHVAGDLAIFTFAGSIGSGGGEVYAWDLARGRLAWEVDLSRTLSPGVPEDAWTGLALDSDRVLVAVDQHIAALELATGKVLWLTALPRQAIRRYDAPWTAIGRHGDLYVARVYEDLVILDVADGSLRWRHDAGPFARPWPLIHRGRLYITTRDGPVQQASASYVGARKAPPTAVRVTRGQGGWKLEPMSRRKIPGNATIWWSLSAPPASNARRARTVELVLHPVDSSFPTLRFDLTRVTRRGKPAFVKFTHWYERAALEIGGKQAATASLR